MFNGTNDTLKSTGNDVKGRAKEAVGDATDNERLHTAGGMDRAKGAGQEAKGNVKDAAGKVGEKVGDAADTLRGKR